MENEMKQTSFYPGYCLSIRNHKIFCRPCDRPDCFFAQLLEAETSEFHTDQLADATRSINQILSEIQSGNPDQKLAFIQTEMGTMLVWATIENEHVVTTEDSSETLAKALKLKKYNPYPEKTE